MGSSRGFVIAILVGIVALGGVGFFVFSGSDDGELAAEPEPTGPTIKLTEQGPRTFTLTWSNLPPETRSIEIYKTDTKWKTVPNIGNPSQGKAELKASDPPKPTEKVTFRAISATSTIVYTSTTTVQTQSTSTGGTGGGDGTPTSTGGTSTSTTGGNSTSTGGNGTSTPAGRTESFWVERTNTQIEIGWQNLPAGTVRLAVSNSPSTVAPWTTIITARGPFGSGPEARLIGDDQPNEAMYYKLETFSSFDGLIGTFGPILLDPITP